MTTENARLKIMVIDDDEVTLTVTRDWLERAGYVVVTRDTSMGSVKAILQEKPDLILLDVRLPVLSGDALAHLIRRTPNMPQACVVLFSVQDDATLQRLVAETGALGAIQKTSNEAAFVADVQTMIRKRFRVTGKATPVTRPTPAGARPLVKPTPRKS